jgi:hypothetical protein
VHWASGSTTEILGYMHDDLLEARVPELEPLTALVRAWWLPREVPRHRLSLLRDGHNPLRDIYIPCRKLTPEVRRRVAEQAIALVCAMGHHHQSEVLKWEAMPDGLDCPLCVSQAAW